MSARTDPLDFSVKGNVTACPNFSKKNRNDSCTPNYKQLVNEGCRLSREAKKIRFELDFIKKANDDEKTQMIRSLQNSNSILDQEVLDLKLEKETLVLLLESNNKAENKDDEESKGSELDSD